MRNKDEDCPPTLERPVFLIVWVCWDWGADARGTPSDEGGISMNGGADQILFERWRARQELYL